MGNINWVDREIVKQYFMESLFERVRLDDERSETDNSVNYHAMDIEDTEILGSFCDMTAIHGEKLKEVLVEGYLKTVTGK